MAAIQPLREKKAGLFQTAVTIRMMPTATATPPAITPSALASKCGIKTSVPPSTGQPADTAQTTTPKPHNTIPSFLLRLRVQNRRIIGLSSDRRFRAINTRSIVSALPDTMNRRILMNIKGRRNPCHASSISH
jgi:hypothetical protein